MMALVFTWKALEPLGPNEGCPMLSYFDFNGSLFFTISETFERNKYINQSLE